MIPVRDADLPPLNLNLRPYQRDAVTAVMDAKAQGLRRVLYTQATGTGKTVVFIALVHEHLPGKSLIIAHREELLDQAANRMREAIPGINVQMEVGRQKASRDAQVIVSSVQSLAGKSNRLDWFEPDIVIIDEVHHVMAPTYRKVLDRFRCMDEDGPFLVGCTATDRRFDRLNLRTIFQKKVFDYPIKRGMDEGYLCDLRCYAVVSSVDLRRVKTVAGDFNQAQLAKAVNVEARTQKALEHWRDVANDRKTIIFCVNVEHSEATAKVWKDAGYQAAAIHGGLDRKERQRLMDAYRCGSIPILTSCELLTEGVDVPDTRAILLLRPTQSWSLFCQMTGRGLRIAPGKRDCVLIDVVDLSARHTLASGPAILDLPPGMDLEGRSIREAAAKLETIVGAAEYLKSFEPARFSDMETALKTVDLIGATENNTAINVYSRLSWIVLPGDVYKLACGGDRNAELRKDWNDEWVLYLISRSEGSKSYQCGKVIERAIEAADHYVLAAWPNAMYLADQRAAWRAEPASPKQVELLRKLGQPESVLTKMNKGLAQKLISALLGKR